MANPTDPGTLYFNPAGMTYLDGVQTESSYEYIHPEAKFENNGSRYLNPAARRFADQLAGRAAAPRAVRASTRPTSQPSCSRARPTATFRWASGRACPLVSSSITTRTGSAGTIRRTANCAPPTTIFRPLTAGNSFPLARVSTRSIRARCSRRRFDFGLLGASLGVPGYAPGHNDGTLRLEGSDVSFGYNIGGLVEYLQPGQVPFLGSGKIGVSYRSGITQDIDGYATFRNVPAFLPAVGNTAFQGQRVEAKLELPEIYNFALSQGILDDKVTLNAELTWSRWGRLKELPLSFSNPATAAALANPLSVAARAQHRLPGCVPLRGFHRVQADQGPDAAGGRRLRRDARAQPGRARHAHPGRQPLVDLGGPEIPRVRLQQPDLPRARRYGHRIGLSA